MKRCVGIAAILSGIIMFSAGVILLKIYVVNTGSPLFYGVNSWKDLNPAFLIFIASNLFCVVCGVVLLLLGINILEKQGSQLPKASSGHARGQGKGMKVLIISVVFLFGALVVLGGYAKIRDMEIVKLLQADKDVFIGLTREAVVKKIGKPKLFQTMGAINKDGQSEIHEMLYYSSGSKLVIIYLKDDMVEKIDFQGSNGAQSV